MDEGLVFVGLAEALQKGLQPHLERLMSGQSFAMGFSFPISKVDKASRTVEGCATSEDLDAHGEILSYQASRQAFADFAGNVREMHQPVAVGRTISTIADDKNKRIIVRARISRGAEDTWKKIEDGVLRAFSVGGTRVRATLLPDGVRRVDEYRLNEISLVDVPANPSTSFKIVKSLSGRPTVTEIVASDTEENYVHLADALDGVVTQLSAKCRPTAQEVSKALRLAGSGVVCDMLAPDDFSQRGDAIAADLAACSAVLRGAGDLKDLEKARTSAGFALRALVSRRDLTKASRRKGNAEASAVTLEELREQIAKCLTQLRGVEGSGEAVETLEKNVMALQGVASIAGGMTKSLFTTQELAEMKDKLAAQLNDWHAKNLPQNVPEYRRLSDTYFQVAQRLKNSR